ncbi:hypothetical protein Murru_1440 [Allomuricauda ruestringensis DSM 13258]|uniref:Uncharacterized protein n=1 Tax=Allomuricauda ruestringensis (strain DSM 13258 / CIP 107369 / LMG 19739 / B1) TaxID=886377 RepID=G2PQ16_ALLRU|nr:hypothetical protein [Allomuricauda ruestringensis]AEM70481.1 hypothetical protein Murru_1440 [Allomuricauda ruestringensis DSM 13258]
MKKYLLPLFCFVLTGMAVNAQKMPVSYDFGEKYRDRHRYSNLVTLEEDDSGGYVLVRAYYQGLVLKPKGYLIEKYNSELELVSEYNYKLKGLDFVDGFLKNGQLNLLFLNYNPNKGEYEYWVHTSPIIDFNFKPKKLLSIASEEVKDPVGKNYYNRDFAKGFTTAILFNEDKSGFVISTHHKRGKSNKHMIHLFDTALNKKFEYDFSNEIEEKNYAFENVAISRDMQTAYIVGKAYYKKRRFRVDERKYHYELISVSQNDSKTQPFVDPGKYPEGLYPIITKNRLVCVGFYSDRRDNRYNGIAYFDVDPGTLDIQVQKYNPFSQQFMDDKFGRAGDHDIKNLVFKGVEITDDQDILFNAEEYFVTSGLEVTGAGQRVKIERYHYNDIVSVKLGANGDMKWARNINKTEVTQGDGAYASYSSYCKNGKTYFFICTSSEHPQLINNERLIFKQGFSRNRNVFLISLDENGVMDYEKIIDQQEARLPLMVSKPLKDEEEGKMLFYAKQGSRKQLVKVDFK